MRFSNKGSKFETESLPSKNSDQRSALKIEIEVIYFIFLVTFFNMSL